MDNRMIGVFDSGLGGLTVVKSIMNRLPDEKIIYFGDTARTPYGSKDVKTIRRFTNQICDFLASNDVKMIVIACNTVSATCKEMLEEKYPDIPIVDVISPMVDKIVDKYSDKNIGIIGTKVTIKSNAYANKVHLYNKNIKIRSLPCPLFVPMLEENVLDRNIIDLTIKYYLDIFLWNNDIEALVLGCTHYPLLLENLRRLYPRIEMLNPSQEVASVIDAILTERDMRAENSTHENCFYASDLSESFVNMIETIDSDARLIFKTMNP